jgi:hypothetical protein
MGFAQNCARPMPPEPQCTTGCFNRPGPSQKTGPVREVGSLDGAGRMKPLCGLLAVIFD